MLKLIIVVFQVISHVGKGGLYLTTIPPHVVAPQGVPAALDGAAPQGVPAHLHGVLPPQGLAPPQDVPPPKVAALPQSVVLNLMQGAAPQTPVLQGQARSG